MSTPAAMSLGLTATSGPSSLLWLPQWEGQGGGWKSELSLPGALTLAGRCTALQGTYQPDLL